MKFIFIGQSVYDLVHSTYNCAYITIVTTTMSSLEVNQWPMKLKEVYFTAIKDGSKTIEGRVLDGKTAKYAVGDILVIVCVDKDGIVMEGKGTIRAVITKLVQYTGFAELVNAPESHSDKGASLVIPGAKDDVEALNVYHVELSTAPLDFKGNAEKQAKIRGGFGALAIHVKVI